MIPWANFDHGSRNDTFNDPRVQLHEHWLSWVEDGPSMTTLFLETPMLELAHERQFVVSQVGGDNVKFRDEHPRRMEVCLQQLDDHFCNFATHDICQPESPHGIDIRCCWAPEAFLESFPPLTLAYNEAPIAKVSDSPRSVGIPVTPASISPSIPLKVTTMQPETDTDDGNMSDDTAQSFRDIVLNIPRAKTILPYHGVRSERMVRQRKRFDSKLGTEHAPTGRKRSSQWITDLEEEDATSASRTQSMALRRGSHDVKLVSNLPNQFSYLEGT